MSQLPRRLEPEVMDTALEADDYDSMDHREVNRAFVDDLLVLGSLSGNSSDTPRILDVGTGTAQIPIELCQRSVPARVVGIDLAEEMLKLGRRNLTASGFEARISLERIDAKQSPYDDNSFDVVMSNSIVHHIPKPVTVLHEMSRVLRTEGILFVRDLMRPDDLAALESLVETYAAGANDHQRQLFRDSLHAALTLGEIEELLVATGLPRNWVEQTSDRHWTICGRS